MFTQKLFKAGNSIVITIPKQLLELLKINAGDAVVLEPHADSVTIKRKVKESHDVNDKFMKMVDEFANEHEDVLKELAQK